MNKQEIIRELRQRKQALEQSIDQCHDTLEGMIGQEGGYSVEDFTRVSAALRAAQCTLRAVKSRLARLESRHPGPAMPIITPISILNLQNQIKR